MSEPVAPPAPVAAPDDLAGRVRKGLGFSFLNNVIGRLGIFISGLALARLLAPEDYGVFAAALVAVQILLALNDLGLAEALIRWQGNVRRAARTASTLVMLTSAVLYAAYYLLSPLLARALNVPEATGVLRLLGVALLIDGLFSVHATLLTREFLQGRRAIADLSNLAVSVTLSVTLATQGHGAWSLAWGRIGGNIVSGVLLVALSPTRVLPGWDRAIARKLLAFGLPLIGSNLLGIAMLNVDYIIVSRLLGPTMLGFYVMAFNLSSWPVNMFSFAVRRVSLAGFSRLLGDRPRLQRSFMQSMGLLMAVTIPVCTLLAVLSGPILRVVYGPKWGAAAEALRFLALLGILRVGLELAYDLLVALGRSRRVLHLQGLWVAALIPALSVGAHLGGIRGVGLAHLLVAALLITPAFVVALTKDGIVVAPLARILVRPVVGGLLMTACCWALSSVIHVDLVSIAVAAGVALLGYLAVVWPMRRLARPGFANVTTTPTPAGASA